MKIVSIRHVLAETPAAAAGIREGDRIVSVNGAKAQGLGVEEIQNLLCHSGTYSFQLSRSQQKLEITINTNKSLY
jgi:C-terminal processing protease CtpA/Prc